MIASLLKKFSLPVFLSISPSASAQVLVPVVPGKQSAVISFSSEKALNSIRSDRNGWAQFCQRFGDALLASPSRLGFLDSFECVGLGTSEIKRSDAHRWHIALMESKRHWEIQVSFEDGAQVHRVQRLSFRARDKFSILLQDEKSASMLSAMLMANLPTGWAYEHGKTNARILLPSLPPIFRPGKELLVYDLFYQSPGIFLPRVRSRLLKDESESFYQAANGYLPLRKKQKYWIQNTGSKTRDSNPCNAVHADHSQPLCALSEQELLHFRRWDANYVTFFYGYSILRGSSLLTKAAMNALQVEIRSGPWEGLRVGYETVPNVSRATGLGQEAFSMQRISLGRAIEWEPPKAWQFYMTRMELQPTLEFLQIKSHFMVEHDNGLGSSLTINSKNIYDMALTFGVEKEFESFRSRFWMDFSIPGSSKIGRQLVTAISHKAGLSAHYHMPSLDQSPGWELFLSGSAENLEINTDSGDNRSQKSLSVDQADINLIFISGGVALSW